MGGRATLCFHQLDRSQSNAAGDLIVGGGGLRKVCWGVPGSGKSGGARVITYALRDDGEIWLLVGYSKAKFDKLPTKFLLELKKEIDDAKDNRS